MLLKDFYGYLANTDTAALNLGADNEGVISATYTTKVIRALNLAMTELYKEFPIKEKETTIQLYTQLTKYTLHSDFSYLNDASTELIKYIIDSPYNPFLDDVMKIERVFNEEGDEFWLNNDASELSLYTPEYNVIQHPYPRNENAIFVQYRAMPVEIPITADENTYEIDLPRSILNLALLFTAHKLLNRVNRKDSADKLAEYVVALQQAKNQNLFRTNDTDDNRLEAKGWV